MSELAVMSISIEELLNKLRSREWLIPQFQREFVWTIQDAINFAHSILNARPIGMVTLWAQSDDSQLELGPINMPDTSTNNEQYQVKYCDSNTNPKKIYAVLDGRQRCTATAMIFGGFHSTDPRYKVSGRYYLNVAEEDPEKQVVFLKEKEVKQKNYDKDAACISNGLFPLSSNIDKEGVLAQWMRYIQAVRSPDYYSSGILPGVKELNRRDVILKTAFDGCCHSHYLAASSVVSQ